LLQDLIYAKPSVRDVEEAANVTGPSWALADARYLKKFSLYTTATGPVAAADQLIMFNASASAEEKQPASALATYMGTGIFAQASTVTESMAVADQVLVLNASTSAANKVDLNDFRRELVTNDTTTSYTLVATDASKTVYRSNAGANDTIIPLNASVAFETNTRLEMAVEGAGASTLKAATTGVTINGVAGLSGTVSQWGRAVITKRGTDSWVVTGDFTT